MRFLILGSYGPSLITFRGPLIERLLARGHEVHVAAPEISDAIRRALENLGATVHETPLRRQGMGILGDIRYMFCLRRLLAVTRPNILLTYTIKPNIWGAFAAASRGIRSVAMVTGLGYAFTENKGLAYKQILVGMVARRLYRTATNLNWRVIFQNTDDRDDFIAVGCLSDPRKARLVNGSGVDLNHYSSAELPSEPVFLMVARILGAKGVREYAEAAMDVKRTHPDAEFRLVGFCEDGPDAIASLAMQEWINGGLEYVGASDDVRPHLAACRVYVLPSYREGTPRSVLEAMATGRAILTSDAPGCRETVIDGVNGFLVPVRDARTLADKMRWMIENPEDCERMAEESLRIVRRKYDVDKVNDVLMRHLGLDI